jgi:hypothetical protein
MKKLAVLVGLVAIFAWGTGAWADLTFGTWTTKNTYYPGTGATSPSIFTSGTPGLSAALTNVGPDTVDLTISASLTGGPYASDGYTNFVLNFDPSYTGTLPLSFSIVSGPSSITSLTTTASESAPPWPPGSGSGAGVGIGTADILITPNSALTGSNTLVVQIEGTGSLTDLTSAMFDYEMIGGSQNKPNGNYFGVTLDNLLSGSSEAYGGVVATSAVPIPPSVLLLACGLGGFVFLRRKTSR